MPPPEGWLWKHDDETKKFAGRMQKAVQHSQWKRRWFWVLNRQIVYADAQGGKPKMDKVIRLSELLGVNEELPEDMERKHHAPRKIAPFGFTLQTERRDYVLCAEDAKVRDRWIAFVDDITLAEKSGGDDVLADEEEDEKRKDSDAEDEEEESEEEDEESEDEDDDDDLDEDLGGEDSEDAAGEEDEDEEEEDEEDSDEEEGAGGKKKLGRLPMGSASYVANPALFPARQKKGLSRITSTTTAVVKKTAKYSTKAAGAVYGGVKLAGQKSLEQLANMTKEITAAASKLGIGVDEMLNLWVKEGLTLIRKDKEERAHIVKLGKQKLDIAWMPLEPILRHLGWLDGDEEFFYACEGQFFNASATLSSQIKGNMHETSPRFFIVTSKRFFLTNNKTKGGSAKMWQFQFKKKKPDVPVRDVCGVVNCRQGGDGAFLLCLLEGDVMLRIPDKVALQQFQYRLCSKCPRFRFLMAEDMHHMRESIRFCRSDPWPVIALDRTPHDYWRVACKEFWIKRLRAYGDSKVYYSNIVRVRANDRNLVGQKQDKLTWKSHLFILTDCAFYVCRYRDSKVKRRTEISDLYAIMLDANDQNTLLLRSRCGVDLIFGVGSKEEEEDSARNALKRVAAVGIKVLTLGAVDKEKEIHEDVTRVELIDMLDHIYHEHVFDEELELGQAEIVDDEAQLEKTAEWKAQMKLVCTDHSNTGSEIKTKKRQQIETHPVWLQRFRFKVREAVLQLEEDESPDNRRRVEVLVKRADSAKCDDELVKHAKRLLMLIQEREEARKKLWLPMEKGWTKDRLERFPALAERSMKLGLETDVSIAQPSYEEAKALSELVAQLKKQVKRVRGDGPEMDKYMALVAKLPLPQQRQKYRGLLSEQLQLVHFDEACLAVRPSKDATAIGLLLKTGVMLGVHQNKLKALLPQRDTTEALPVSQARANLSTVLSRPERLALQDAVEAAQRFPELRAEVSKAQFVLEHWQRCDDLRQEMRNEAARAETDHAGTETHCQKIRQLLADAEPFGPQLQPEAASLAAKLRALEKRIRSHQLREQLKQKEAETLVTTEAHVKAVEAKMCEMEEHERRRQEELDRQLESQLAEEELLVRERELLTTVKLQIMDSLEFYDEDRLTEILKYLRDQTAELREKGRAGAVQDAGELMVHGRTALLGLHRSPYTVAFIDKVLESRDAAKIGELLHRHSEDLPNFELEQLRSELTKGMRKQSSALMSPRSPGSPFSAGSPRSGSDFGATWSKFKGKSRSMWQEREVRGVMEKAVAARDRSALEQLLRKDPDSEGPVEGKIEALLAEIRETLKQWDKEDEKRRLAEEAEELAARQAAELAEQRAEEAARQKYGDAAMFFHFDSGAAEDEEEETARPAAEKGTGDEEKGDSDRTAPGEQGTTDQAKPAEVAAPPVAVAEERAPEVRLGSNCPFVQQALFCIQDLRQEGHRSRRLPKPDGVLISDMPVSGANAQFINAWLELLQHGAKKKGLRRVTPSPFEILKECPGAVLRENLARFQQLKGLPGNPNTNVIRFLLHVHAFTGAIRELLDASKYLLATYNDSPKDLAFLLHEATRRDIHALLALLEYCFWEYGVLTELGVPPHVTLPAEEPPEEPTTSNVVPSAPAPEAPSAAPQHELDTSQGPPDEPVSPFTPAAAQTECLDASPRFTTIPQPVTQSPGKPLASPVVPKPRLPPPVPKGINSAHPPLFQLKCAVHDICAQLLHAKKTGSSLDVAANEAREKKIGLLVRNELCPALTALFLEGWKTKGVIRKRSLWDFVEEAAKRKKRSASDFGGIDLPAAVEAVTAVFRNAHTKQNADAKFQAFLLYSINQRKLAPFVVTLFNEPFFLAEYYIPPLCVLNPQRRPSARPTIDAVLEQLSRLPLQLQMDAEVW